MSNSENNKRIAKNTLALYFRQIITMLVSLFTSRIVLQTLGVSDYGINNVVGGVVAMMSFLTTSLSATTQRFLSVELGRNDIDRMKRIFANSLSLHVIFIFITIIFAEIVGLWFVKNKLVIPPQRMEAALWVYQFSVISLFIGVLFSPFDGAIRAHEKFDFYAKISVFDVVMRLVIVYLLTVLPYDKLAALSFMGLCVGIIGRIIVYIYCRINFEECGFKLSWEKNCIRQLLGYNVYGIVNVVSFAIKYQGLNMILNFYYGPTMNAALGIANAIYVAVFSFFTNAAIAAQPQIIMSYAQNNKQRLWNLIIKTSRLYFLIILIPTLPFVLEIKTVLYIWLGNYPDYTAVFAQLFLIEALLLTLEFSIGTANMATGKLRATTINKFVYRLFIFLFSIFVGINKLSPIYIYIFAIIVQEISFIVLLLIVLKKQLRFSLIKYFTDVILPISKTSMFAALLPIILHYFFSKTILSSCVVGLLTLIWSATIVFYMGLNNQEKHTIVYSIRSFLQLAFKHKFCG